MFRKFLKNFIILLLTFIFLGLSVYLFLPEFFDIGLNSFLHNESKPIPFESYDATEYIVAESEESAHKRALEAAYFKSKIAHQMDMVFLSIASSAVCLVSFYFGFHVPITVPLAILSITTSKMVEATGLAQTSPKVLMGLHGAAGTAIILGNFPDPIVPILLSYDIINIFILHNFSFFFKMKDLPSWVDPVNAITFPWVFFPGLIDLVIPPILAPLVVPPLTGVVEPLDFSGG